MIFGTDGTGRADQPGNAAQTTLPLGHLLQKRSCLPVRDTVMVADRRDILARWRGDIETNADARGELGKRSFTNRAAQPGAEVGITAQDKADTGLVVNVAQLIEWLVVERFGERATYRDAMEAIRDAEYERGFAAGRAAAMREAAPDDGDRAA